MAPKCNFLKILSLVNSLNLTDMNVHTVKIQIGKFFHGKLFGLKFFIEYSAPSQYNCKIFWSAISPEPIDRPLRCIVM